MTTRIQKQEVVRRLAQRMNADEKTAAAWLDACTETVYDALKQGESVTLPHFGGFYVRPRDHGTWTFRFNPSQRWRALFGWSSSYKGDL